MFSADDTIVAVATPSGHGGLGVVRLSGPAAASITQSLAGRARPWPVRRATRAAVDAGACRADAVVTYFAAPGSYTGEEVVEVALHGNPTLLAGLVERAVEAGARVAAPGEFTLRAFVRGKLDLVQAEAVRDLVDAVSPAQLRAASDQLAGGLSSAIVDVVTDLRRLETLLEASIDFPDEGYRFIEPSDAMAALAALQRRIERLLAGEARAALVREGATVVVAGAPNVGKSSLFNALVGADRAIVTPVPGTTRDLVSERLLVDGQLIRLVDSAGLRATTDVVEAEGVRRAARAAEQADLVLLVLDRSQPLDDTDRAALAARDRARTLVVANKCDLLHAWLAAPGVDDLQTASAKSGAGMEALVAAIAVRLAQAEGPAEDVLVTNQRQRALLRAALARVRHALDEGARRDGALPEEFVLADLRGALRALEEVTGRRTADAMLDEIFATFCIGK